jgi:hypothetical protein
MLTCDAWPSGFPPDASGHWPLGGAMNLHALFGPQA